MKINNNFLELLPTMVIRLLIISTILYLIIFGIIKGIQFIRKNSFPKKGITIALSIIYIIIVGVSWIFNMGWFRFFMTFLLIPVIHSMVFFFMNISSAKYFDKSKRIKVLNIIFFATFLMAHVFMPDGGDAGEMYFFFGLVHSNKLSEIAAFVSNTAFGVHVVTLIWQFAEIRKIKKSSMENQ